jgi:hypothetical protein
MATSVKKERSRRTSWLSPMWRDIDSLRKQNESTKKEIESMRRKSKQTETETEQLRSKSKQIEIETEQLRSETEILRRQNRALELIESSDLNALLREATIPGGNDLDHSEDQLNLDRLAGKFVALCCDADDIPFLFGVLELTKEKELSPLHPIPEGVAQANKITTLETALEGAFMEEREFKLSGFDEQDYSSQLSISRQQQHRSLAEHAYRSNLDRMTILRCSGPDFYLERVIFPFEVCRFQFPPECRVQIWGHGLAGPELIEELGAEDLLIETTDASIERIGSSWIEAG